MYKVMIRYIWEGTHLKEIIGNSMYRSYREVPWWVNRIVKMHQMDSDKYCILEYGKRA